MRIVSLAPYLPYRNIPHAGGVYYFHYLEGLVASGDDVTVVVPSTEANESAFMQQLPRGVAVHIVPTPTRMERAWMRAPLYPFELATAPSPGLLTRRAFQASDDVRDLIEVADLVELQWSAFLPFVNDVRGWRPGVPVSAVLHDLYGESLARMAARTESMRIRTAARLTHERAGRRELELVRQCDLAFSFNDRERLLVEQATGVPVHRLDPWIDWPSTGHAPSAAPTVLFAGDLGRHENHEAARWLVTDVWPRVLRAEPSARLVLAGADPPATLTNLASASVEITGYVRSLAPYYDSARVFVAPLRTGAGLKFKVAQALASGLPVVATTVAADGFAERGGASVFGAVTDDADDFATGIVRFLHDRQAAEDTGHKAASWARATFSFGRMIDAVRETYLATSSTVR